MTYPLCTVRNYDEVCTLKVKQEQIMLISSLNVNRTAALVTQVDTNIFLDIQ